MYWEIHMATYWESTVMSISEGWDAKYGEMDGYGRFAC